MIFQPDIECASEDEIKAIQLKNLKDTVKRCYENVPHYKKLFDEIGIVPNDISSLDDLSKLPFTVKNDLRDNYPYGLFAVPMRDVVRIHASSGTTGKATVVGYTKNDLDVWSDMIARIACMAGATPDDIVQVAFGYGLFTGAFGLHYGMEKLGATVIPISSGNSERQINLMRDFGSTILISTPSYSLYLYEYMKKMGVDPKDLKLRLGMFGGEGCTQAMADEIHNMLGITVTENYGLSEVMGPGVSGECTHKCGMHINEDSFILEVIDPKTGEVLPEGSEGELVITSIRKEALPILRYRTHDITTITSGKCECGRTSKRMAKVKGRTDDMLIIRGVNVFPSQIESVLVKIEEIDPHYEIIVTKNGYMDALEILVEPKDIKLLESFDKLETLINKIRKNLRTILQIDAKVRLVEPETLKRFEGKASHVTDKR